MYFRRPDQRCLGVYKMALPALYLHQLSEPMGQCGWWYMLSLSETTWNNKAKKLISYFAGSKHFEEYLAAPS